MSPPLGAQRGEAGEVDGGGPGIHIPGYMMSPPLGAQRGEAGEVDGGGPGIHIPGCMMSAPLGAQLAEAGEVGGGGPGIDIPGYMMSPPLGAQGAEAGEVDGGGGVAGETSEPNFDENVLKEESSVSVEVTADFNGFSGLDKQGEGTTASQNPKIEIQNPKSEMEGLNAHGEADVRGSTEDRNSARVIGKPESRGLRERRSNRERRRMRREMERKEVERRIEKLLMVGGPSAKKMIEKVLAASPRVRRLAGLGTVKRDHSHPLAGDDRGDSGPSASRSAGAAAVIGLASRLLKLNEEGWNPGGMTSGPGTRSLDRASRMTEFSAPSNLKIGICDRGPACVTEGPVRNSGP